MKIVDCEVITNEYNNSIVVDLATGQKVKLHVHYPNGKRYNNEDFIGMSFDDVLAQLRLDNVVYLRNTSLYRDPVLNFSD